MALTHIHTVSNWGAAFEKATTLFDNGVLTAVGITTAANFRTNQHELVAMHLNEHGKPQLALHQLESVATRMHSAATMIELWYGPLSYVHPSEPGPVNGWVLWLVY